VDRKKECINTGGEKVFPLEVEEVINRHPKVDDVCVIGVPDEEWGHTIRAVVQLKKGEALEEQEIREFCRGEMAGYKIPRTVVFADELPHSPVGKMLRQTIRERYGKA
jgi:acyl-CoA synthetase (AMP-forming)/AMP-acid ligase II